MAKVIAVTILMIGGSATWVAFSLGYFLPVELESVDRPGFTVVGYFHRGDYQLVSEKILKTEELFADKGVSCDQPMAIFFDDPNQVELFRLHSFGGCQVTNIEVWQGLIQPNPDRAEDPLSLVELSTSRSLQATFGGSPGLGPLKVYPAAQRWLSEKGCQTWPRPIEIYPPQSADLPSDSRPVRGHTTYFFDLICNPG